MNYCSECGSDVEFRIPEGDSLKRYVCKSCSCIHYQNPKIVAGCIPEWEDKILLCKRAIEPRLGLWTLPAGFMENKETTAEAAIRETWEEACSRVTIESLYGLFSIPHISQVYMIYRARMLDTNYQAGTESLEVKLFTEDKIPWDKLAFPVITETLQRYYQDRKKGKYGLHIDDLYPIKN